MATYGTSVRRGLPRTRGGQPWPPVSDRGTAAVATPAPSRVDAPPAAALAAPPEVPVDEIAPDRVRTRSGLPRVSGGEPWPPAQSATTPAGAGQTVAIPRTDPIRVEETAPPGGVAVRRGLPRIAGGEPWPPARFVAAPGRTDAVAAAEPPAGVARPLAEKAANSASPGQAAPSAERSPHDASQPLPFRRSVWPGEAARRRQEQRGSASDDASIEPRRIGPFTRLQWSGVVVILGTGVLLIGAMAVLLVRWLLSTAWGMDFLAAYPGENHLPEGAPVGFPGWLGWQHFLNVFLMVLIIRSGLQVRTEKRPTAFWSPRRDPSGKVSLTVWFHQALDVLWLVNGVIFIVLLFATGQWMRVIPTSWEVFPNALSAILQYVSLDWPTENGWVNYNSIQQIAYFVTIFIAAPVAALSGFRMSGLWPSRPTRLSRAYPIEWARTVHFPTMLYFVAFIAVHVFLVFATGALRNLNHMYAVQGSTDPNAYSDNWTGFWFFVASLVVIVAAAVAARPLTVAPLARLFGQVSGR